MGKFDLPKKLCKEPYAIRVMVNATKDKRLGAKWIFEGIGITRVYDLPEVSKPKRPKRLPIFPYSILDAMAPIPPLYTGTTS